MAVIAAGVLVAGNVGAGLSQVPLTRSNASVYPNVMFTLTAADDATAAVTSFASIGDKAIVGVPGIGASSRVRVEGVGASKLVALGKTPIGRQWRQIAPPPAY
ncbi:hypothetical protein J7E70_29600 [Variovorax paradoxus]|nr:hypothetical protein [Variovorax paradoxus]